MESVKYMWIIHYSNISFFWKVNIFSTCILCVLLILFNHFHFSALYISDILKQSRKIIYSANICDNITTSHISVGAYSLWGYYYLWCSVYNSISHRSLRFWHWSVIMINTYMSLNSRQSISLNFTYTSR